MSQQQGQYDQYRDGGYPQHQGGFPQHQGEYPQHHQQGGYGGQAPNPNDPYGPQDSERGLGKTVLGAAAGGFAGNKLGGHAILGAIGGAIAANFIGGDKDK